MTNRQFFLILCIALVSLTGCSARLNTSQPTPRPNLPTMSPTATPESDTKTLLDLRFDLESKKTEEFTITVPQTTRFGVSLIAPQWVEISLIDPNGKIIKSIRAYSQEAEEPFGDLSVDNPKAGVWTLRLVNKGNETALIFLNSGAVR